MENPFSAFNIEMPRKYDENVKRFCLTAGGRKSRELAPFERQVDFWFFSIVLAADLNLSPAKEGDTYNVTPASILSTNPFRITYIQALYLAVTQDLEGLADNRKVLDFAIGMANAGIPHLVQVLDEADQKPLWNVLDDIEGRVAQTLPK